MDRPRITLTGDAGTRELVIFDPAVDNEERLGWRSGGVWSRFANRCRRALGSIRLAQDRSRNVLDLDLAQGPTRACPVTGRTSSAGHTGDSTGKAFAKHGRQGVQDARASTMRCGLLHYRRVRGFERFRRAGSRGECRDISHVRLTYNVQVLGSSHDDCVIQGRGDADRRRHEERHAAIRQTKGRSAEA